MVRRHATRYALEPEARAIGISSPRKDQELGERSVGLVVDCDDQRRLLIAGASGTASIEVSGRLKVSRKGARLSSALAA
jgi:hypothetical protein